MFAEDTSVSEELEVAPAAEEPRRCQGKEPEPVHHHSQGTRVGVPRIRVLRVDRGKEKAQTSPLLAKVLDSPSRSAESTRRDPNE